jgi:hypothetical protein
MAFVAEISWMNNRMKFGSSNEEYEAHGSQEGIPSSLFGRRSANEKSWNCGRRTADARGRHGAGQTPSAGCMLEN